MRLIETGHDDSRRIAGGAIPGAYGAPAFTRSGPSPSRLPILIAAPHGGRVYPEDLVAQMRHPTAAALKLEDRYVDRLAEAAAEATGAGLLVAHAARAMIDLNRAADDVDWDMFSGDAGEDGRGPPSRRALSGLGLVPRRLPGMGELWKRRQDNAELALRIEGVHQPYHACLADALAEIRDRWGAALLIDLHSMPPLPASGLLGAPEFVVGDRFGASCHGGLIAAAFSYFSERRRTAAHNRPYAGGYVIERHATPERGVYAMQLEIDRTTYLDSQLSEIGPGFDSMVADLIGLVERLAGEVGRLGRSAAGGDCAEAAE